MKSDITNVERETILLSTKEVGNLENQNQRKMSKTKKNRKNKNKNRSVQPPVQKWLIEEKYVPTTTEYVQFKNRLITELGVNEDEYREDECGSSPTESDRMMILQNIRSSKITFLTEEFLLNFTPINDGIYLHLLMVNPQKRRSGVGKSVMRTIQQVSDELNVPVYLIPVLISGENVEYEVLKKFYKSFGYNREKTSRYWKYEPNSVESDSLSYGMVS